MPKTSSLWEKATRYISFRPRTEWEVRQHLGPECTEELITRLKELDFINDAQYTADYIASRSRRSPRSSLALAIELKRRGINTEVTEVDDLALATQALAKKMKTWLPRLKASRFLASRGFSPGVIEKVVKTEYNSHHVK